MTIFIHLKTEKKKQLKNSLCYNFNGIAESIVDKYLMKNLNCKRCKSAFQNYVYMCYVNVSNSKISVFYIIWIALQALSTQLAKSISCFRECSSIMSLI